MSSPSGAVSALIGLFSFAGPALNNTGKSVFAAALFHATMNLTFMLFPVYGSYFDMRLGALVMAFAAAIVTVAWGPKTLARYNGA